MIRRKEMNKIIDLPTQEKWYHQVDDHQQVVVLQTRMQEEYIRILQQCMQYQEMHFYHQ